MGKGEKRIAKMEDEGDEETPVIDLSSGDDEANEDLSLKIVEKALLMRAAKIAQNQNDIVVLDDDRNFSQNDKNDSGVVGISSGDELAAAEAVREVRKKKKKMKKNPKKEENKSVIAAMEGEEVEATTKEEERTETVEKLVEAVESEEGGQTAMESDKKLKSNAVGVDENLVLRKLLRGPRYFDPPDSGWSTCYNCGKEGHAAVNCPFSQKKRKPCFLCGGLDHVVKQCSKERICIICKSVGHRPNKCPEKHKGGPHSRDVCLKCGDSGHNMFACQNNYSLDDLKEMQCYICKKVGHLCCVNSVDTSTAGVSCYKCGEMGHIGSECSIFHEKATTITSSSTCFKCGEGGHFARECTSSVKAEKRNHEPSTPNSRHQRGNKEAMGFKSAPQELCKFRKKKKSKKEERSSTTPKKSKQRGGWLTDDPGDSSQWKSKKNHWRSPSTPSYKGHKNFTGRTGGWSTSSAQSSKRPHRSHSGMSSSPSYKNIENNYWGTPPMQGTVLHSHHRFSATRFNNSDNLRFRGNSNYNWW